MLVLKVIRDVDRIEVRMFGLAGGMHGYGVAA